MEAKVLVGLEELTDIWENYGSMFSDLSACDSESHDNLLMYGMINSMLSEMPLTNHVIEMDRRVYDILYTCASV